MLANDFGPSVTLFINKKIIKKVVFLRHGSPYVLNPYLLLEVASIRLAGYKSVGNLTAYNGLLLSAEGSYSST